jgi:hypothetical protein
MVLSVTVPLTRRQQLRLYRFRSGQWLVAVLHHPHCMANQVHHGRLAGTHPVGKPVSHLAHWAGVHGSLLAAMIVTALAAGSLLCAARRNRQRRQQSRLSAARLWWMPAT